MVEDLKNAKLFLQQGLLTGDTLDNFEVLLYFPNTSPESAVEVFDRCVKALVRINPLLQVVIGLCSSAETTSARGLIQLADKRFLLDTHSP